MEALGYHEVEIFCDGPACSASTYHGVWAESEQGAFGKARAELVRTHGWVRMRRQPGNVPVDLCPQCKDRIVRVDPPPGSKEEASV